MKRTYQPNYLVKKRKHGFLKRNSNKSGKRILLNRRRKNKNNLSV